MVGEYSYYFLVFFDETDQEHTNGVFLVWDQCWLDLQILDRDVRNREFSTNRREQTRLD